VLNRAPGADAIPKHTQERIRAAAERFGYRPNTLARSLRRRRSFTIGVMMPEISDGYAALVMSGIEDFLLQAGYLYFVVSHRHRRDLIDEYPRLMLDRAVDGLIAVDTPCEHTLPVPVVAVSGHGRTRGVTNIVLNHDRAAWLALEHLHALGHRRTAFIKGQRFSSDTDVRWSAIRRAARRLGLAIDRRLVVQLEGDTPTPDLGYAVTRRLLHDGGGFTALFAFNDVSAIGALRAVREAHLRVPEDVSIVGFDDIPSAEYQFPALTTVRQPLRRMGEIAAETLVRRIGAPHARTPRAVALDPELIVRGSTGPSPTWVPPRAKRS
jgi:LacI family transcriptional regulator